ncbi:hypothetical protein BN1723_008960 [Verticillium longisporum]|uniref:Uncharacterized protein n=1 Tax=Verticillium longisporum TaxID=100787 RepID=A0A0G4KKN1_VERLO|nr:hypothetical protein BN1723_008960 [Verticillium longisporum]
MSDDSGLSHPDYASKYALPDAHDEPLAIRLIQIQPRIGDNHPTESKIVLRMRVVSLDASQLVSSESPIPTGRPSVRFDEEMNLDRPQEFFGIARCSMPRPQGQQTSAAKHRGRMSRFITKLKPKLGTAKQDTTLVPLSEIPDGEPKVRNRFTWGNYVAMSYSWGKKEDWEFTEKERKEAARKEEEENENKRLDPTYKPAVTDEDDDTGTYTDGDVHEVILDGKRVRVRYNLWAALLAFQTLHRDDSFLYKRNWDFIQANRELPIAGKPLSSYFTFQPVQQSHLTRLNRSDEHSYHKIAEAHRAMEARTKLRRLMTTSNRALMGLVPASTQQGDVVIILYYHSRPLIATAVIPDGAPEDSDDVILKLKGEAFIPGVMNGELADSGELDTLPLSNLTFY